LGGAAMFAGFLVTVVIAGSLGWFKSVYAEPVHIIAIVAAAFLITLIGFLDDLYDLDWSLKLAGQFLVAGILAWQGVQIVSLPIGGLTIGSFGISFIATVFLRYW
jgi:UDP-GlcNAc:undecaprenyl-phosphate GlcNAc-1-phosphate transferase